VIEKERLIAAGDGFEHSVVRAAPQDRRDNDANACLNELNRVVPVHHLTPHDGLFFFGWREFGGHICHDLSPCIE